MNKGANATTNLPSIKENSNLGDRKLSLRRLETTAKNNQESGRDDVNAIHKRRGTSYTGAMVENFFANDDPSQSPKTLKSQTIHSTDKKQKREETLVEEKMPTLKEMSDESEQDSESAD